MNNDRLIAVFDSDEAYARALSDCINRNKRAGLMAFSFSDGKKLAGFLNKNPAAYLLAGTGFDTGSLPEQFNVHRITVLTESLTDVPDVHWLYKYQSVSAILTGISDRNDIVMSVRVPNQKKITAFIGFDSPGTFEFDDSITSEMKDAGVLVLDMRVLVEADEDTDSVSDLIYCIEQDDNERVTRMLSAPPGELTRIGAVRCFTDHTDMSAVSVKKLSQFLAESDNAANIVIYFDISVVDLLPLMDICGEIISICKGRAAMKMTEVFKRQLSMAGLCECAESVRVMEA